jgi:hypothetical protein
LEYIEFSIFTIWIGSQAAQMLVNVTTSLKRIVQISNSPATEIGVGDSQGYRIIIRL